MGKTVILSEETVRDLLEAHATLSAWYYELWASVRAANGTARAPDDATRAAFVERLATDFPEAATVARSIKVPRMFVPAPLGMGSPASRAAPSVVAASAPAAEPPAAAPDPAPAGLAPPPFVNPGAVKY